MNMIDQLRGPEYRIRDERVLEAMSHIPRHEFVPSAESGRAYHDSPLPIGCGQTISQPYIVALMTEKLEPRPDDTVLEIGTGSGYQTAVLASLVAQVYTIEVIDELADRAAEVLDRLGYENVTTRSGDGYDGWPEHAPYDAIIVTCAPDRIPPPLVDQLREGGRMMIPVGSENRVQELFLLEKKDGAIEHEEIIPVRFVPMTGHVRERREN